MFDAVRVGKPSAAGRTVASVQRPPTVAQPGRIVAVPSLTRGSAAPLVIRRLRIKPDKRKGYVEAKANDQDAVETRHVMELTLDGLAANHGSEFRGQETH